MSAAAIAGWICTVVTLVGYGWSVRASRPVVFHVANTVGVWGIAWSAVSSGAWPNLALTVAFGAIGLVGWVTTRPQEATVPVARVERRWELEEDRYDADLTSYNQGRADAVGELLSDLTPRR